MLKYATTVVDLSVSYYPFYHILFQVFWTLKLSEHTFIFHKQSTLFLVIFFSLKMTFSYINVGILHLFWLIFECYLFFNISNFNLLVSLYLMLSASSMLLNLTFHLICKCVIINLVFRPFISNMIFDLCLKKKKISPIHSHYAFLLFLSFFYDCIFIPPPPTFFFFTYWMLLCYFLFQLLL